MIRRTTHFCSATLTASVVGGYIHSVTHVQNEGAQIFWRESGEGPPLLLIMGLGYTSDMWYRIEPAFAESHRTIMFDNRGVGQSDIPPGPYSISSMASDAGAVLDAAGLGSAHVFGVSLGGYIAQEFALTYPERVRSLTLGCTGTGGSEGVLAEPQVVDALLARKDMTPEEGSRHLVPYIYDESTSPHRVEEDLAVRVRTFPSPQGYQAQLDGVSAWEGSFGRLGQLTMPVQILHGEHDQLVPPQNAQILNESISGSTLLPLPDASHIIWTDQPERVIHAVAALIRDVEEAG